MQVRPIFRLFLRWGMRWEAMHFQYARQLEPAFHSGFVRRIMSFGLYPNPLQ